MPRGDLVYNDQLNHGMRKKNGMPPSRNTVFVSSNLSEKELEDAWSSVFGKPKKETNGGYNCTCDEREIEIFGEIKLVTSDCAIHGKGKIIKANITDIEKDHSLAQKKKAKEYILYGNTDIREVMNRN